jgi:hypothetical protein
VIWDWPILPCTDKAKPGAVLTVHGLAKCGGRHGGSLCRCAHPGQTESACRLLWACRKRSTSALYCARPVAGDRTRPGGSACQSPLGKLHTGMADEYLRPRDQPGDAVLGNLAKSAGWVPLEVARTPGPLAPTAAGAIPSGGFAACSFRHSRAINRGLSWTIAESSELGRQFRRGF